MSRARVAVLDADPRRRARLLRLLGRGGYSVVDCPTPGRLLDATLDGCPEALLMGMRPAGMDGRELIRVLRADPRTRTVLIVAMGDAADAKAEAVAAFQAGADEYLSGPVDPELLAVRLEALLRRAVLLERPGETLRAAEIELDLGSRGCRASDAEVRLTRLEFDLLAYLLRQRGRVITRGLLLQEVWRGDPTMGTRTVDKHVENLRRKLGPAGRALETVSRVGYMLR